ncbi:MAG: threonine synthase [Chlamydiota bacterium]
MKFYSTLDHSLSVSLKEAMFSGLAPEGGLYLPNKVPTLSKSFIDRLGDLRFVEIAETVACHLLEGALPDEVIRNIVRDSFPFDVPLVNVEENIYSLETYHGPTLSFKDFGARFMARLFGYFLNEQQEPLHILVATSGDTGSAVAQGFYQVPGIQVWVLYPKGKISEIQEKQITTMGGNIHALEIEGVFDDCQSLVKTAFQDEELRSRLHMTSANSINIARLIPQSFYYFYAYGNLPKTDLPTVISVPSGNFGNLTGGLLAKRMGLPVHKFIAATNVNDIVPKYLESGVFEPKPSIHTLSNAMDVGDPSNFVRLLDLYGADISRIKGDVLGASFNDDRTLDIIRDVEKRTGYVMDPHGAVGYLALKQYPEKCQGVFLETAHPAKFKDCVEQATGKAVEVPGRLQKCLNKQKVATSLPASYSALKEVLTGL